MGHLLKNRFRFAHPKKTSGSVRVTLSNPASSPQKQALPMTRSLPMARLWFPDILPTSRPVHWITRPGLRRKIPVHRPPKMETENPSHNPKRLRRRSMHRTPQKLYQTQEPARLDIVLTLTKRRIRFSNRTGKLSCPSSNQRNRLGRSKPVKLP